MCIRDSFTYSDLPDVIDYVVITHNHQDHVLLETLLQIRHKTRTVVVPRASAGMIQDPSLRLMLEQIGFSHVVELSPFESVELDNGRILGLPFVGEHADLDVPSKLTYLLELGGSSLLFAADSQNLEPALYDHVARQTGPVDALFLGMERCV